MNIITESSRAYHKPWGIQSVAIAASFTAWVLMDVAVVESVVSVLVVVGAISVVVVAVIDTFVEASRIDM